MERVANVSEGKVPRALEGIKVLDLSRVLAGPWSTQILADFGADVLKVELPGKGDDTRGWGPPFLTLPDGSEDPQESAYYVCANRNKRSAAIDIAKPEGARLVRRLAAEADILVENFKVGGLAKYGLDYASVAAINPRLVYCSITGFGQSGPYADRGGYDFVAQGMGGFMSITGEEHGGPLRAGVAMADLSTGMYATVSIMMALRHAERTEILPGQLLLLHHHEGKEGEQAIRSTEAERGQVVAHRLVVVVCQIEVVSFGEMVGSKDRNGASIAVLDGAKRMLQHVDAAGAAIELVHDPARSQPQFPSDVDRMIRAGGKGADRKPVYLAAVHPALSQQSQEDVA